LLAEPHRLELALVVRNGGVLLRLRTDGVECQALVRLDTRADVDGDCDPGRVAPGPFGGPADRGLRCGHPLRRAPVEQHAVRDLRGELDHAVAESGEPDWGTLAGIEGELRLADLPNVGAYGVDR